MVITEKLLEDGGVRFTIELTKEEKRDLGLRPLSSIRKVDLVSNLVCCLSDRGYEVYKE